MNFDVNQSVDVLYLQGVMYRELLQWFPVVHAEGIRGQLIARGAPHPVIEVAPNCYRYDFAAAEHWHERSASFEADRFALFSECSFDELLARAWRLRWQQSEPLTAEECDRWSDRQLALTMRCPERREKWHGDYPTYLKTRWWQRMRAAAFEHYGRTCDMVARHRAVLNVHHRTYDNLGREELDDLRILCRECHARLSRK